LLLGPAARRAKLPDPIMDLRCHVKLTFQLWPKGV
jgi:hypothetical protein